MNTYALVIVYRQIDMDFYLRHLKFEHIGPITEIHNENNIFFYYTISIKSIYILNFHLQKYQHNLTQNGVHYNIKTIFFLMDFDILLYSLCLTSFTLMY